MKWKGQASKIIRHYGPNLKGLMCHTKTFGLLITQRDSHKIPVTEDRSREWCESCQCLGPFYVSTTKSHQLDKLQKTDASSPFWKLGSLMVKVLATVQGHGAPC